MGNIIMKARQLILERVLLLTSVENYIEAMKALLIKLIRMIEGKTLSDNDKYVLKNTVRGIIDQRINLNNKETVKKLLYQLKVPTSESSTTVVEGAFTRGRGDYESIIKSTVNSLGDSNFTAIPPEVKSEGIFKPFNNLVKKIKSSTAGSLFGTGDEEGYDKTVSVVIMSILTLATGAIFYSFFRNIYLKFKQDKYLQNIINTDIKKILILLTDSIIDGKIPSESYIEGQLNIVKANIMQKYNLRR